MIENQSIVLTGASSGIGLEVLKLLREGKGNRILAVARHTDKLEGMGENVIPMSCDIGSKEGVEAVFARAEELFGKIDVFYANAGFAYIEDYNYTDWDRVNRLIQTNTLSPIYTYARYLRHLDGRPGRLAITVSAIGEMAMPGYAVYSASKFAVHGFQQAVRLEKPDNLTLTCVYPVATDTNFFKAGGGDGEGFRRPFPVQKTAVVAKKAVRGIEKRKKKVSPCFLFGLSRVLMTVCPPVRTLYWRIELKKHRHNLELMQKQADAEAEKEVKA
ncbi:MAG: SDR family NAD(P)-dependent oxidoreductase [Clostridia bacterium]|nr:SDR family NAD(P)-dependent oxidoreductase [Clostridia bacterium]